MKKTVTLCGKDVEVAVNAASLIYYKNQFNRDGFQDMLKLAVAANKKGATSFTALTAAGVDFDFVYRFLWIFVYCANKDKVLPFEEFIEQFEVPPIDFINEALPIVLDLLVGEMATTVKPKKK